MTDERDVADGHAGGQSGPSILRHAIEFGVVGGGAALLLLWVIPSQTQTGGELGLTADFVPKACAIAIGALAVIQFVSAMTVPGRKAGKPPAPIQYGLLLFIAATVGAVSIAFIGLAVAGGLTAALVMLVLGERRPLWLAAVAAACTSALYLIELTGI